MKRTAITVLSLILIFSLTACNKEKIQVDSSLPSDFGQSNEVSFSSSEVSKQNQSSTPVVSSGGSQSSSESENNGGINWGGSALVLKSPLNNGYASVNSQIFVWSNIGAESYTFFLEEKEGTVFKVIKTLAGLKSASYQLDIALKAGTTYRWRVEAIKGGKTIKPNDNNGKGAEFMAVAKAQTGKDYSFDGKISEQVLKNYLARSMTLSFLSVPSGDTGNDIRMILNTGAKYISRAAIPWQPETEYTNTIARYKSIIDEIHKLDSDVVIETCIFETVYRNCEEVAIPDWVFRAFGKSPENRNFNYQKMLFPSGKYVDHWGVGVSVPDITQLETQMYFYFRACKYIDAGFEGIHWGQVMLMGETDTNHQSYFKVLTMVRDYANSHARRHFIFNNAHTPGMVGPDGVLLFDFHAYPARIKSKPGETAHAPTEANPQKAILEVGYLDSIYKKSQGGKTVSGWSTSSLPYFVEIDNWGEPQKANLNKPGIDYWPWGMDEISWFVNQPKSYRQEWMKYAYNWVRSNDSQGFFCLTGSRPYYSLAEGKITWYHAINSQFFDEGFDDENIIKEIFSNN